MTSEALRSSTLRNLTRAQTLEFYHDATLGEARKGPDALLKLRRELCRNDLFYLMLRGCHRLDINRDWVYARCREVEVEPDGYLDLWSREHFKSTLITFGLTIKDILNDPELTFGLFSHIRPIAKGFLRQIKWEFETNDELKEWFPDILWADPRKEAFKWSEDDGIIVKRKSTRREATVEAWGLVDSMPTGKHFDKRVYDDVVTETTVTNPEQVRKTMNAIELSSNLGTEGGVARYIGTRYSMADPYQEMIDRGMVRPRVYPGSANGKPDGKPVMWTQEVYNEKRRAMSARVFAAQILQNPQAGTDVIFTAEWLRGWETRPRTLNVYIMGDPSMGRSATSDRTALIVVGIAAGGAKLLLDGYCHRMSLSERWANLRQLHERWSKQERGILSVKVGWERYGMQTDTEYFQERMRIENYVFAIEELSWVREGPQSKMDRIERLEPDFKNSRFFLPAVVSHEAYGGSATWAADAGKVVYRPLQGETTAMREARERGAADTICQAIKRMDEEKRVYDLTRLFIDEFLTAPYGVHDDALDAASRVYDLVPVVPDIHAERHAEPPTYPD